MIRRATTTRLRHALGCLLGLVLAGGALRADKEVPERQSVIVVTGAPGTDEYGAAFELWADTWEARARAGGATVYRIGAGGEGEQGSADGSEETAADTIDRDRLATAIAAEARPSREPLWIVLIGHGTFDGKEAKFNLRGPDVAAAELAEWLAPCQRTVAVVVCASSSSPFINRLSGPDRIILAATKSGHEYNYSRFGGHLARAIAEGGTDIDKDGQVSLLEAFVAAAAATAEFYKSETRLATEHATLDDNGDGLGTPGDWFRGVRATRRAKDDALPDGLRANQLVLVRAASDSELQPETRRRRDELELELATLRDEKSSLDEDAYYARLEKIALELARLYEE